MASQSAIELLIQSNKFEWLEPLKTSLFEKVLQKVSSWQSESSDYDGYLFETCIVEIEKHLQLVEAYRRQYIQLEEAAVRSALDYDLFVKNQPILAELEKAGSSNLKVDEKWRNILSHHDKLVSRHKERGHALNFQEKLLRAEGMVLGELRVAYFKAQTAKIGMTRLLGFDVSEVALPVPSHEVDYIDELVNWHRRVTEKLKIRFQSIGEYERVFPLVAGFAAGSTGVSKKKNIGLYLPAEVEFDLTSQAPVYSNMSLLKGVAVSLVHEDSEQTFTDVLVTPPGQHSLKYLQDDEKLQRKFSLSSVRKFSPHNTIRFYRGWEIRNIYPWGKWKFTLSQIGFSETTKASKMFIKDIRLHLVFQA